MKLHIFNNGLMLKFGMSGSDRRALEWTKIFLRKGLQVQVYTPKIGEERFKALSDNLNVIRTVDLSFLSYFPYLVYLLRSLVTVTKVKFLSSGDILYSTSDLIPDSIPAFFVKFVKRDTKWIIGVHLLAPSISLSTRSLKSVYYFLTQSFVLLLVKRWADLVLVSNNLDRKVLINKGFFPDKVMVTYGAVDFSIVGKAKAGKLFYDAAFIGRFHPQKGLGDLLKIWKQVCRKKKDALLVIMGELEQLLPEIQKMRLEKNIIFLGFVDGIEKYEVLKSSKIFLFPSYYESFGLVVCEAMACGLPVVAYDLPIYKDVYPEGMVRVPIGNYEKFSLEILELLDSSDKRLKMSKRAQKVSRNFSWEQTADNILKKVLN